ncbi:ATPase [Novosphingobium sp.]|uniref:ATPase n=1 Tax=Novosphingobium sp. TaxID=1874826 RepID=UPI0022BCEF72|nr:ATPase [Novosphingobium sp.]MCZ8019425.1 ATPase [Novosphingobium sp.]MCZ8035240.1 ATPase [Novosphingobium sp.]MCZ8050554.1 ATPase [Novosphingobium sp.]MCZ8058900.1 ATPase [Novosphingobium sp.]MCZ8232345.1 ATPase [Novosphingobium sp.]
MSQIALPLHSAGAGPSRIVVGSANLAVLEACAAADGWPFRTAVLLGPPRSGKSLIARWFEESGAGEAVDDADRIDETELFHRWNRAQESGRPLLVVGSAAPGGWHIALPDLASRLGAALQLEIGAPDDAMLAELIAVHAEQRDLPLGPDAAAYLVPRIERTHMGAEQVVSTIDRLSLERKQAPGPAIWRAALEEILGPQEPRLL